MKCYACGYAKKQEWDDDKTITTTGEKEFIPLNISGSYENTNGYYPRLERVELIMCPICGTVRVNEDI